MYPNLTPFDKLRIGVNPVVLTNLLSDWSKTATDAELLAARDTGVQHWASLAASPDYGGYGVLTLSTERHDKKEDRTYCVAPFPVASIPKALRPAFTAAEPGHVLIDLDWKASHWQILAFKSGDQNLISDLRPGDLYTTLFPELDRKTAKAALNTTLNGGGVASLTQTIGTEDGAKAFLDKAHALLGGRWAVAGAFLRALRAQAVAEGWVTPEREYAGSGVMLMRLEAEALRTLAGNRKLADLGVRVVLPMHDGILLSAPAAEAEAAAKLAAQLMAYLSTGSKDEARDHTQTWVKWVVSSSWTGSTPQLVGHDLRAAALRATQSKDRAELLMAAAAMPTEVAAILAQHHHASAEGRVIRQAVSAHQAAVAWHASSLRRKATPAVIDTPPIDLPHGASSYTNICRVLRGDSTLPKLRWNARESSIYIGDEEASDTLIRRTYLTALEDRYGMIHVGTDTLSGAVVDVARESEFDPVRDYLSGLTWDGQRRLSTWLHDYAQAKDLASDARGSGLVKAYSDKWMVSIVARAFDPGCKVDTMLVLMGGQGAKKSSLLRAIAPCGSFAAVQVDPADKDSVLRASKVAVVEWPELAGASKREQESLKDYFSLQEDRVRPPYARGDIRIPRRTVFAATTNEDDFLRDSTGSRRYWPVQVGQIDLDGLMAVKDQLWAEAVDLYHFLVANDLDYKWWLNPDQEAERERQATHFTSEDPWRAKVWNLIVAHNGSVTLDDVCDALDIKQIDRQRMTRQVTQTLKSLGMERRQVKVQGMNTKRWVYPKELTTTVPRISAVPNELELDN